MIWRRFRRNRAAMAGGFIVILYYLVALFANFIAPYSLSTRFIQQIYLPPQRIHLFDGNSLHPYVNVVETRFDENLRRIHETTDEKIYRQNGEEVDTASIDPNSSLMRSVRGDEIAMIFQEPMTSLSPMHTIHIPTSIRVGCDNER